MPDPAFERYGWKDQPDGERWIEAYRRAPKLAYAELRPNEDQLWEVAGLGIEVANDEESKDEWKAKKGQASLRSGQAPQTGRGGEKPGGFFAKGERRTRVWLGGGGEKRRDYFAARRPGGVEGGSGWARYFNRPRVPSQWAAWVGQVEISEPLTGRRP